MNGPEHFREAEKLIAGANELMGELAERIENSGMDPVLAAAVVQPALTLAQVHATLALAAAHGTLVGHMEDVEPLVDEWRAVAGATS